MSKSYSTDIVKFASKIRNRNQGMIDDYAKAQQKQALIGSIGNALTGVVGAYGQYKQQQQQQAASQQIGAMPELGLSPDVSGQIAPNQLLSAALAIRARNQQQPLNPLQQAELDYKKAQLAQMPVSQKLETELTQAQIEAQRALASDRLREPPRIPVKIGADGKPVLAEGSYAVDPADALRLASGGGTGDRWMKINVREGDPYNLAGLPVGEQEIPATSFTAGVNQTALTGRQGTANAAREAAAKIKAESMSSKERQDALVRLNIARAQLLQSSGDNIAKLIGNQISAAQMSAGSPGRTLEDFASNAQKVVGGVDIAEIDAMIEALQNAENQSALPGSGSSGLTPASQPSPVLPPPAIGLGGTLKQLDADALARYSAATPEQRAQMRKYAESNGYDVSGLK